MKALMIGSLIATQYLIRTSAIYMLYNNVLLSVTDRVAPLTLQAAAIATVCWFLMGLKVEVK